MSEIENNFKSRLKNILIKDKWTLKQYYPIKEGEYEIKVLFKKMIANKILNSIIKKEKKIIKK